MKYLYRPGAPGANERGMVPKEEAPPSSGVFHYWQDIPPYMSPLGTGEITSRTHRREELARHNCREVEPSEFRPSYSDAFRRKHGIPDPER